MEYYTCTGYKINRVIFWWWYKVAKQTHPLAYGTRKVMWVIMTMMMGPMICAVRLLKTFNHQKKKLFEDIINIYIYIFYGIY